MENQLIVPQIPSISFVISICKYKHLLNNHTITNPDSTLPRDPQTTLDRLLPLSPEKSSKISHLIGEWLACDNYHFPQLNKPSLRIYFILWNQDTNQYQGILQHNTRYNDVEVRSWILSWLIQFDSESKVAIQLHHYCEPEVFLLTVFFLCWTTFFTISFSNQTICKATIF